MSQNVTNGHRFGVTGTFFKTSVFQTYISYKYMYDHGLRMTNLTCLGIDPPGRTSPSKAATLSIMSTALSFCMYVIPSLRIDLLQFFGSLARDMKFGCSVTKCDEKLNEGDSRKTLRESHEGLSGNGKPAKPLPPINRLPAIQVQSLSSAPFKKGVSPPHATSGLRVTGKRRERKREREGASGFEME